MYETDSFKISAITDKTVVTKTYSMPLADYIEKADLVAIDKSDKADVTETADTAQ